MLVHKTACYRRWGVDKKRYIDNTTLGLRFAGSSLMHWHTQLLGPGTTLWGGYGMLLLHSLFEISETLTM